MSHIISVALWTYLITIVFAMLIAVVIRGMAIAIEKLGLDREGEDADATVPSANPAREEEALAVAIAVAHARKCDRL
jgi:Na+-transporting methylmalonyl-CoA/oxaloacetate decarboxylase gamma subunit